MATNLERIEIAARAISRSKGRNPDDKIIYQYNPDHVRKLGFADLDPSKDGVWVCDIEEASRIVAVIDALKICD